MADYPPPPMFEESHGRMSDDELHALQERRFLARIADAWRTRFYQERWTAAGLSVGDIRSLEDLSAIPTFTSDDLKKAIDDDPPFGTHHPIGRSDFGRFPIKIQTSGGTTGLPRTTLFDQVAWEVQGVQFARALWAQGGRPGDVFQIPFTNSLGNAAWAAMTGIFHWLAGVPVTSGSGVVTPTRRQVEFAALWGTNCWVTFSGGEYLLRLKEAADELGINVKASIPLRFIHAYMGVDENRTLRRKIEDAWGAPVYDNYGSHEIGIAAFECQHQNGLHLNEDTVILQVADIESGALLENAMAGNVIATSLHRSVPPIIRYNMRDRLAMYPRSDCECGLRSAKLSGFLGRSDEMIKLRGQNIYPRAIQETIVRDDRTTGEFLVVVETHRADRVPSDEMTVRIERTDERVDAADIERDMVTRLHEALGIRVNVEIVEPGSLATWTKLGGEGKVKRLLDLREPG